MSLFDSALSNLRGQVDATRHLGAVLGVFEKGSENIAELGFADKLKTIPITQNHLFEIGSVTKPLIGLLFAKLHLSGELSLYTRIGDILADVRSDDIARITIREILTHTSGLPRLPINLNPSNRLDPYADYTKSNLYEGLKGLSLGEKKYCYSNLGFSVLGEVLFAHRKQALESILTDEIFNPLGMNDSFLSLSDKRMGNLCEGHLSDLSILPPWNMGIFSAAGEVKSSIRDALRFARAYVYPEATPFPEAINLSMEVHHSEREATLALAWNIGSVKPKMLAHEGGTYGFRSLVLISPKRHKVLVALSNTGLDFGDLPQFFLESSQDVVGL